MIECENGTPRGSLYTGYTLDIERRYRQHCEGKGAKYTRARKPRRLAACWLVLSHAADAQRVEYYVKQLSCKDKYRLVLDGWSLCDFIEELEVELEVVDLTTLKI